MEFQAIVTIYEPTAEFVKSVSHAWAQRGIAGSYRYQSEFKTPNTSSSSVNSNNKNWLRHVVRFIAISCKNAALTAIVMRSLVSCITHTSTTVIC